MASSTKTKLNPLFLLIAVFLMLRPVDAASAPQFGITAGASKSCLGVSGEGGGCQRFARAELTLNLFHYKHNESSEFVEGSNQIRDNGVEFGVDAIKDSPRLAFEGMTDIRQLAGWPAVVILIFLFGLAVILLSFALGTGLVILALLFGTETTVGLYALTERSYEGAASQIDHYGAIVSGYPFKGTWFRVHTAGGVLQLPGTGQTGHSFKAGLGLMPPADRSGPLVVAEVERLRIAASGDIPKTESRQLALSAGFAFSF